MQSDLPSTYDIRLTSLVYGGDAIGRLPDGRAVFVPFGLPGETARIGLVDEKRGHVRARLEEIIVPSHARIQPRCAHFGVCGGCHYQHMAYQAQLEAKTAIVREQLERIGGIENPPVGLCVPSPAEWHYRNNIQFHPDQNGKPAYLALDGHTRVTIQECHLPEPILGEIWPQLDFDPDPLLNRIDLRSGTDGEVVLGLESLDVQGPEMTLDMPISVVFHGKAGSIVMAGEDTLTFEILNRSFRVSSRSFFQVNLPMAAKMVDYLLTNLPLTPGTLLIDVYCGVGLFSAFLAGRTGRLVGIEISPDACDDYVVKLERIRQRRVIPGAG